MACNFTEDLKECREFGESEMMHIIEKCQLIICKSTEDCELDLQGEGNAFTNFMSPRNEGRIGIGHTPKHPMFDSPYSFLNPDKINSPNSLMKTPTCLLQKTINLSFSQPSTPRTPAFIHKGSHVLGRGTPCVGSVARRSFPFDAMLLNTPMLIRTLDSIQAEGKDANTPYPDILQLIDTDDQHLPGEISDHHITDLLLDHSQAYKHQAPVIQPVETNTPAQVSADNKTKESSPRTYKRKQRKTKPMTEEERQSLQKIKQEKREKKLKNSNMSVPLTGTRKSNRIKRSVVRF